MRTTFSRRAGALLAAGASAVALTACYVPSGGGSPEPLACTAPDQTGGYTRATLLTGNFAPNLSCNDSLNTPDVDWFRIPAVGNDPEVTFACFQDVGSGATWDLFTPENGDLGTPVSDICSVKPEDRRFGIGSEGALLRVTHPQTSGQVTIKAKIGA